MSRKIFLSLSQATVDDLGPGQSRQVHSDRFLSKTVRGGKGLCTTSVQRIPVLAAHPATRDQQTKPVRQVPQT